MNTGIKTAAIAAFVFASASAALAQSGEEMQNSPYQYNPNAPVPIYEQQLAPQAPFEGRNVLIEGRNVDDTFVRGQVDGVQTQAYPWPTEDGASRESFGGN